MATGLNLVLLGNTGAGKSLTGNTILGRKAFALKRGTKSITRDINVESGTVDGFPVNVYDTPGFSGLDISESEILQMINKKVLQKSESGLWVFVLVIKAHGFTSKVKKTVEKIEELLGEKHLENTWILFTRGDELEEENMTIQEFIDEIKELKTLVQKYDHRYHVFNNKKEGPSEQVDILLAKTLKSYLDMRAGEQAVKLNPLTRKIPENVEAETPVSSIPSRRTVLAEAGTPISSHPPRRIVLVGKSGVGKSAAGNIILRQKEFTSVMSSNSVTFECTEAQATVSGRSVSVVDTPGLFDTGMNVEELMMEIARSVYISSPGPHAFLIVFPVNMRFTGQEQQIPQLIEMMFGQEVLKYSIILFTHGDQLEGTTVEKLIQENCKLRDLVQKCGGRYQLFNNRDQNNREQVDDLLQKIDLMVQQNGGGHYSNQMYEDAQKFRQEEEEKRQTEEDKRKQQELKQKQEDIERAIKDTEEKIRAECKDRYKSELERLNREREELKQKQESSGFMAFFKKHKHYFYIAAVVAGIVIGGAAGGALATYFVGGALTKAALFGVVATGAISGGAIGGGAVSGTVAGAVGGAAAGVAAVAGAAAGVAAAGTAFAGAFAVGGTASASAVAGAAATGGSAVAGAAATATGGAAVAIAAAGGGSAVAGGTVGGVLMGAVGAKVASKYTV